MVSGRSTTTPRAASWGALGGVIVSAVCVYLLVRGMDWARLATALTGIRTSFLVLGVLCGVVTVILMGRRWSLVIDDPRAPWPVTTPAVVVGLMVNNILPGRLGEFVRALHLDRTTLLGKARLLGTVVVDRLFDLATLVLLGTLSAALSPPVPALRSATVAGGVVLGLGLGVVVILLTPLGSPALERLELLVIPARFRQRVRLARQGFLVGLGGMRTGARFLAALGLSMGVWASMAAGLGLGLQALGLHLSLWALVLLLVVSNLITLVPSSPGAVGTYDLAFVLVLRTLGVERELAVSAALVNHALWYVPPTLAGLVLVWRDHLGVLGLARRARADGAE